jgi:hypothetical protein
MKHSNGERSSAAAADVSLRAVPCALQSWERPRLVRVGSVAQVTAKTDNLGRSDGGTGQMKRT